jgi:pyridoxine 5-phosphate synthase
VTSQAGWPSETPIEALHEVVRGFRARGVRVSMFVDPDPRAIAWAARLGADRVELYTEPFARAFEEGASAASASFARYAEAARAAHDAGLGINAGHDLDLDNLRLFKGLPHLDEVSIGHAIVSRALFVGLETVVREYLGLLAG